MNAVFSADLFARAAYAMSADPHRYYLSGVAVQPCAEGGVILVATNGTYLLAFHDPHAFYDGAETSTIVQPSVATLKACRAAKDYGRVVVITGSRLEVVEAAPKTAEERSSALVGEGLRSHIQAEPCLVDGSFPEWRRVLAKGDLVEGTRAALDAKALAVMGKALNLATPFLRFWVNPEATGDQIVHHVRGTYPSGFGVIISGRIVVKDPLVPTWA